MHRYFLPRPLHPFAWWGWALALAVAANATTNPLLLISIVLVACLVTFSRRGDNPWARGFAVYLWLGVFVVVVRVLYRILFGGGDGPTVLFRLPELVLPWWVGGIRVLGPVSLESVLTGAYDGSRLAAMIICLGAANSLANPKRLLAALPGALYEVGTILVVAVGVFPQLGDSLVRVQRARKLRKAAARDQGRRARARIVETLIVPVLSDALDRSAALAASMDVRGYGRHGAATRRARNLTTAAGLTGLVLVCLGAYLHLGRLGGGLWFMVGGVLLIGAAMWSAGRTVQRTRYRPIRWRLAEWLTLISAAILVACLEVTRAGVDRAVLFPSVSPVEWPSVTPLLGVGLVAAALPAFLTPEPSLSTHARTAGEGMS